MSTEAWSDWILGLAQYLEKQGHDYRSIGRHIGRLKTVALCLSERGLGPESLAEPEALEHYLADYAADFQVFYGRLPGRGSISQARSAIHHLVEFARESGRLPRPSGPILPPYVAEFLHFCRVHRGLSESTLRAYEKLLSELSGFVARHHWDDLAEIPLEVLDEFAAELSPGWSRKTLNSALSGLRGFLRWLFLVGRESEDRSGLIEGPRVYHQMRLPKYLTDEQLEELYSRVDRSTRGGKQEWAVILLVSLLGLRIGEVVQLRLEDLDLEAARLRVHRPKTGACSLMPLCPELKEALENYLLVRPETHHLALFVTWQSPIRPYAAGRSLSRLVSKHLSQVKGVPMKGPHVLRHTLARRLRQGGAPLPIIRRVLGHANSDATSHYLRIATEELAEVADNYAEFL